MSLAPTTVPSTDIPTFSWWRDNEVCVHPLLICAELVVCHQLVLAVVDVCGVLQLQATIQLTLLVFVETCLQIAMLNEQLTAVVPLQRGQGVTTHQEGDAPVQVLLGLLQMHDGGRD